MTRVTLTTANTPGAVAIVQLHGGSTIEVLRRLTGRKPWPSRRAMLVDFAGIDEGLAIAINEETAQLMPHGGPRVVQRLIEHLVSELGCTYEAELSPQALYPEASSPLEADVLNAIAKAASPAAIDCLVAQPELWREVLKQGSEACESQRRAIAERSQILNRLVTPPTVVVAGPANVGKSTLTNALMGKRVSIVADLPGTTRDWVGGLVELNASHDASQAIATYWLDTPGLRDSADAIEQRAIALAKQQIEQADVLIAMRDADQPWLDVQALPREPDLYVVNKVDEAPVPNADAGVSPEYPLPISATGILNLDALQMAIIHRLGLDNLPKEELWAFSAPLLAWCETGEPTGLSDYLDPINTA